jgi:hypothetical protein
MTVFQTLAQVAVVNVNANAVAAVRYCEDIKQRSIRYPFQITRPSERPLQTRIVQRDC